MNTHDIAQVESLVAALADPDSVLDSFDNILGFLAGFVASERSFVTLADEEQGDATIIAARGVDETSFSAFHLPLGRGVLGELDRLGGPLYLKPAPIPEGDESIESELFADGALLAPVTSAGHTVGAVAVIGGEASEATVKIRSAISLAGTLCSWATQNVHLYQDLEKRFVELTAVFEIGKEIVSNLNTDSVLQLVIEKATRLIGCEKCSVMLINKVDQTLRIFKSVGLPEGVADKVCIPVGEGIAGRVAESGEPILIKDIEQDESTRGVMKNRSHYRTRSLLSVPLVSQGAVIGVINVNNKKNDALFTQGDLNLMNLFANQVAIAIQNARLHSKVERLAITDGLTGLHNRAFFTNELQQEFQRAESEERPLSVVLCDIDFFKSVNDTYGHGVGDEVLKRVADALKGGTRDFDVVARYGGEEFVLLLRGAPNDVAARVAERLRVAIEEARFDVEDLRVTASFGLCSYGPDCVAPDVLIKRADDELYRAKESGRNRVCSVES
jgi:diguanylate cyclase (GGDEF)-like protein